MTILPLSYFCIIFHLTILLSYCPTFVLFDRPMILLSCYPVFLLSYSPSILLSYYPIALPSYILHS